MKRLFALLITALPLVEVASAEIFTVGAPNGTFPDIDSALIAAQDGDVVLLNEGLYGGFTITNKSLTIMPRIPGHTIRVGNYEVQDLQAGKQVTLRGLQGGNQVRLADCAGSIRVERSSFRRIVVTNSENISLWNVTIEEGIASTDSRMAVYQSNVHGMDGWDGPPNGGPGSYALTHQGMGGVFLSGCAVTGGNGGDPMWPNGTWGAGGDAILATPGSVSLLDCQISGGWGSTSGSQGTGFTVLPGVARSFLLRESILDTKPIVLRFVGQPGDVVECAYSTDAVYGVQGTDVGPLLVSTAGGLGFFPIGTIPASGELEHTMHLGDVPSQEVQNYFLQARMSDAGGGSYLSNSSGITIYDECTGVVPVGERFCSPGASNSLGLSAVLNAYGSDCVASNRTFLHLRDVPGQQFGLFLCSQGQDFVPNPGGALGSLCLGGGWVIGRYNDPGQVQYSGTYAPTLPGWYFHLELDWNHMPNPGPGFDVALAQQSWHFQAWYRDSGQSCFSDAIRLMLR